MTAAKLGHTVNISESTVVRFAAELGYDGYPAMQKAMQEMIRNKLTTVQRIEVSYDRLGTQDVLDKVLKRELDVGFVIGQVGSRELWVKELFRIQLSVLVYEGHPLYGRESLSVQDLQGESLISLNEKFSCYHSLVERCRDFGFVPAGGMSSGPASPAMKAVWAGSRNIP